MKKRLTVLTMIVRTGININRSMIKLITIFTA